MHLAEFDRPIATLIQQALCEDGMPRSLRSNADPQTAKKARLLRQAKARGLDVSPPTITPEQIIQAALAPPAAEMIVTDDTTDEELSAFIRGKARAAGLGMLGEASKQLRTFHVHWGMKRQTTTLGHYIIEAPNERAARKEAKRYLDARFLGSPVWRIAYVNDVEEEAAAEKARAEYEAKNRTDETVAAGAEMLGEASSYVPEWFTRGKRVDSEAAGIDDYLEGDEFDWDWRLCKVPLAVIETDPAPDVLDQDRLNYQRTAKQAGPVVLGIRPDRIQVYDGWHRITIARERGDRTMAAYVGMTARHKMLGESDQMNDGIPKRQVSLKELRRLINAGRRRKGLFTLYDMNRRSTASEEIFYNGEPVTFITIDTAGASNRVHSVRFFGGNKIRELVTFWAEPILIDDVAGPENDATHSPLPAVADEAQTTSMG